MKKTIQRFSIFAFMLALLIIPYFVFADNPLKGLNDVGSQAGYAEANETTISTIAGTIVAAVLGLLGVIFITLIIYAGIIWMTAQGEEQKVEKAQKILKNSIVGLIITISAWAIYIFIKRIWPH